MTFPNLFLVGAMKAGTTALYSWLESHPRIYMSPLKEPNHFCSDLWETSAHIASGNDRAVARALHEGMHAAIVKDESLYLRLFPQQDAGYRYLGEATPSYLRSRVAAANIKRHRPDAKILVLLRDPVERAWSHYVMERNEARVPDTFEQMMDEELEAMREGRVPQHGILESGLYSAGIARYLAQFDAANVFIADNTELKDRTALIDRLNRFLEFDRDLFPPSVDTRNPSIAPRFPRLNRFLAASGLKQLVRAAVPQKAIELGKRAYYGKAASSAELDPRVRARLVDFYRADVAQLRTLLGPQAPGWTVKYSA